MRIAVTGGIGSGKSEVIKVISSLGYNCISSDEINKSILQNAEYISKIAKNFPTAVKNNKIDKRELSKIVFTNKQKLQLLNSIAHPIIRKISLELSCDNSINFVEVPLLFECGFETDYNKVVLVSADLETRVGRASKRDNKSKEEIISIINNQIKSYEGKKIDYTIINNGSIKDLTKKVKQLIISIKNDVL